MLNLTQHRATQEQIEAGVVDLKDTDILYTLLTFDELPSANLIGVRAYMIAMLAKTEGAEKVMIGGAPYLMGPLEQQLKWLNIQPYYAFSERESVDVKKDGKVVKVSVFKHKGFVEV